LSLSLTTCDGRESLLTLKQRVIDSEFTVAHDASSPPPHLSIYVLKMELYTFGFNGCGQLQEGSTKNLLTPTRVLQAESIKVLCASWCDAVIAYKKPMESWRVQYSGHGLTETQRAHLPQDIDITKTSTQSKGDAINFFGTAMHDGVRGYYLRDPSNGLKYTFTIFSTESESEEGVPEIRPRLIDSRPGRDLVAICMGPAGEIFVSIEDEDLATISHSKHIDDLWKALASDFFDTTIPSRPSLASFKADQLCANSTTVTALSSNAVYTSTRDPRYPQCLGRPYDDAESFQVVSYLSETRVIKIASGGYMTAAISDEGELFLWGQACPGSAEELAVLKSDELDDRQHILKDTGISIEDEQDNFVKCLTVRIDGEAANVYDVAIGHGHILVAAEGASSGAPKRAMFAAGDNSKGQLGLSGVREFVRDFEEVWKLRGKKVEQFEAAGWSSFVVASEG
jgi:hypothetical protein